jgi:hypothetical protein
MREGSMRQSAVGVAGFGLAALILVSATGPAGAGSSTPVNDQGQIVVTLQNHVFAPAEIHVPAGQRTQILLKNLDATAEEFDSTSLKIEKVVAGKSEGVLRLRPLDPGSYPFVGEYNSDTAKGVVIAE